MKGYYKVFALITLILVLITITNAQQITYNDSWGTHGFSLLEDDGNTISINYSLAEFYLEDLDLDGEQLKSVKVPGIFLPNNEGAPDLAGTGREEECIRMTSQPARDRFTEGGALGYSNLGDGKWGMASGDGNCDGAVTLLDKAPEWEQQAGEAGYDLNDHNMDGQVDNTDKDEYLLPNIGKISQMPE